MLIQFTVASVKTEKRKTEVLDAFFGGEHGVTLSKKPRLVDDYTQVIMAEDGQGYVIWYHSRKPERVYPHQIIYCDTENDVNGYGQKRIRRTYTKDKFHAQVIEAIGRCNLEIERAEERIKKLEPLLPKEKVAA